jgi:hypothetical protein
MTAVVNSDSRPIPTPPTCGFPPNAVNFPGGKNH